MAFASIISTGFHFKTQVKRYALDPFASDTPNAAAYSSASALLFCTDLLLACVCLQGVFSQHPHACARRLSSLLATGPVRTREHCQLLCQYSIIQTLVPTVSRVSNTWQVFLGFDIFWHSSFTMNVVVCSILTEEQNIWQPVTCICDADPDSMVLTLRLLSRRGVFKSQILHEHINVSGIVLIHDSSLPPSATSCSTF